MLSYQYKKHFELDEARSFLPMLKRKLQEIRTLSDDLKAQGFDIYNGRYKPGFHPDTFDEYPAGFRKMLKSIKEIASEGIEIKGIENGLVDFPAVRKNGEEVFLCWKIDEDDIEFWHPIDGGYKSREHIDDF